MHIGSGEHTYEWIDGWAKIPDTESARTGWSHSSVVVTEDRRVVTFHQGEPRVLIFDVDGNLESSWESDLSNAHGIAIVKEGGSEYLWLADNLTGQVVKTTLGGETIMRLKQPDLAVYRDGEYKPTSVAVYEERHGGNGDVWVADGYGESYVHRYDKSGEYIGSINGEEGEAGAFTCPHGVWIDTRKSEAVLYVADRSNGRVQAYSPDGMFKRVFGTGPGANWLHSPTGFAGHGDLLVVPELRGSRITLLDAEDELVCYLGEYSGAFKLLEGWPNVSAEALDPGRFNSPHGAAADAEGNLYVSEWLVGGRITKLQRIT